MSTQKQQVFDVLKGQQYIVINTCIGKFGLSDLAQQVYKKKAGLANSDFLVFESIDRDDPHLVQTVRELGDRANWAESKLKIVAVPDGVKWYIDGTCGHEHVAEIHRIWS